MPVARDFHIHLDNVMMQFIINKRTDGKKTDVNLSNGGMPEVWRIRQHQRARGYNVIQNGTENVDGSRKISKIVILETIGHSTQQKHQ